MKSLENPRILIAYTTSDREPFRSLERKGALGTWTKHVPPNCKVISLQARKSKGFSILYGYSIIFEKLRWGRFGRPMTIAARIFGKPFSFYKPETIVNNSSLILNIPEGLSFMGFKLLGAIDLMIEEDFEFLIYTNLSSYINTFRLAEILSMEDPLKDYYAGKRLPSTLNHGISGSFVVLSRKTCSTIRDRRLSWNHAYLDDIALLKLTKKLNIGPTFLESLEVLRATDVNLINSKELLQYPHFKCGPQFSGTQRTDYLVMTKLNDLLFPNSKNS